jgi:trk system potassium uptake protein TrkA
MKILIAGGGKIGSAVTEQLSGEGHEITVIDFNPDVLELIQERYDVITVVGNAASMTVLEMADVASADLLVAATDLDEVNMLACLTAHRMNPNLTTIGRIRNPEYRYQAYEMKDVFGLSLAVNPEQRAAREIARLLKYPGFLSIDTFAKGIADIVELKVDANSPLKNKSLSHLPAIIHTRVLVCAVLRNGEIIMPDGNFQIQENDLLFITAATENLTHLLRSVGLIVKKAKRVLIMGGGKISYYLIQELKDTGIRCTIVEQNHERCEELAAQLPEATIVEGDASSQEFLDSEGVGQSDAVVTLTGLDELNIVISLYAHTRNVSQVITKLSHAENNKVLNSLEVGSVISPKELASFAIVRYVRAMQNQEGGAITVHRIAGGKIEAIEFEVKEDTKHIGEPLRNIKTRSDALICCIIDHGRVEIPSGSSKFSVGNTLVVVTSSIGKIRQLNDIFGD